MSRPKVKRDLEVSPSRALVHVDRDENGERPRADARSSPKQLEFGRMVGLAAEVAAGISIASECPCGAILSFVPPRRGQIRIGGVDLFTCRIPLVNRCGCGRRHLALIRFGQLERPVQIDGGPP